MTLNTVKDLEEQMDQSQYNLQGTTQRIGYTETRSNYKVQNIY